MVELAEGVAVDMLCQPVAGVEVVIVDGVGGSVGVGVGWVSYERDDDMMDGRVSDHAIVPG